MKTFYVIFTRIGSRPGHGNFFEARTMAALEKPLTEYVQDVLGKDEGTVVVTVDPENKIGQIDYGLLGNFTIAEA